MASSLRSTTNSPTKAAGGSTLHQQRSKAMERAAAGGGGGGGGGRGRGGDPSLLQMADARWLDFAEPGFDPPEYAEGFFLTHSEAEADERCAELMVR